MISSGMPSKGPSQHSFRFVSWTLSAISPRISMKHFSRNFFWDFSHNSFTNFFWNSSDDNTKNSSWDSFGSFRNSFRIPLRILSGIYPDIPTGIFLGFPSRVPLEISPWTPKFLQEYFPIFFSGFFAKFFRGFLPAFFHRFLLWCLWFLP